jgi:hypothetical protein
MIRGLLEKEIRQHATLAVFITVLMAVGLFALSSNKLLVKLGGSSFSLLADLWFSMLPLVALVLGTGLVATEFRNKTQLFLEGLPMPRWMMLVVKYLLGLGIVSFCVVVLLTGAWWHGRNAEVMTVNFALLLLAKSLGWAWFCWSVCFAHGFLGRYRGWTGVMLVLGLIGLQQGVGVMVTQFGPFDLISDRFAYERFVWPVEALWVTFAMIVATTLAGFALGIVRDATVAAMMSEKMSIREKGVLTVMTLTALLAAISIKEKAASGKPLNLPGSVDFQQRAATVSTAAAVAVPTEQEELALNAHGVAVAKMLEEVGVYLNCESLPPVYLIHRRDFDAETIEEDEEQTTKCVLIRCNLLTTQPGDTKFQSRILVSVLDAHQLGRLNSDTRGWVLKGFSAWWPARELAKTPADLIKQLAPEGNLSSRTLSRGDLENWLKTTAKMTPAEQSTCAGLGMIALGDYGEEPRRRFLAAVLGYSAPMSARATFHDWLHPVDRTLQSTTGSDLAALASKWTAAMQTGEAKQ